MHKDSTKLKLELAFGCLIALLVGVGWLGLSRMGQINDATSRVYEERGQRLTTVREAGSYVNANFRTTLLFFLEAKGSPQELAAYAAKIKENNAKGAEFWDKVEKQPPSSEAEKEFLTKIRAAKAPADAALQKLANLLAARGKSPEVTQIAVNETLPLLSKFRDAWAPFTDYQIDQLSRAGLESKAAYETVRRLSVTCVSLAIALALCIALFSTRRLGREMAERERSQASIRELNNSLEKKVAERTAESARIAETLNKEIHERRSKEENSRRLAAIVESSDDAIIAATLEGVITDWNAGAERMLGYSRAEMIGKPLSLITPQELQDEPLDSQAKLLTGVSGVRLESVRIRKDGRRIQVAIAVSPIVNQEGRMVGGSAILRDITDRKFMEDALRRSEASYRSFVQNAPFGILRTTPDGRILQANPAMVQMLGCAAEDELLGLDMAEDVYSRPEGRPEGTAWAGNSKRNSTQGIELEWRRKDGSTFTARCDTHVVLDGEGFLEFLETFVEDVTERREMELQLRQRQKMEAIGLLAGGIAHDFNNLLGVISGYAELLSERTATDGKLHGSVEQIQKAASRASSLTRQLLVFSRQQVLETKVLDLNLIVADMARMLPRLLCEDIQVQVALEPVAGAVKADQGQIEQVIMNLAVNARDAMPGGGTLEIRTRRAAYDVELAQKYPSMAPGEYVALVVSDTGMGMDKRVQAHIFEPFFTTKERGRGTGLGLATVYGFVKQIGGYIWVESEPGHGSIFAIYLPITTEVAPSEAPAAAATAPGAGSGTILLVEDEESLRTLTRNILEESGYVVLEASDGARALEIAREHSSPIDLLLTDMVMPGMDGRAVAERVLQFYPEIKVAYMSGYTGMTTREAANFNGVLIAKPFTRNVLLQKLREALETTPKMTQV